MRGRQIAALAGALVALGGVCAVSAGAGTGAPRVVVVAAPAPTAPAPMGAVSGGSAAVGAADTAATLGSSVGFNGTQAIWLDDADLARELDGVAATGSHWLRVDFPWSALESAGRGRYSWAPADRLVAAANARGIHLLALAAYTPAWNRPAGTTDHYQPTDPTAFAEFVRAAAQRYAPHGLHAWEIWNEPNTRDFWQPVPDVARYTQLLRLGSAAIHSVDPAAFVVSAGVAPAVDVAGYSVAPNEFIAGIYANGGGPSVQAVGLHPYSFPYPPMYPAQWNTFYMATQTHAIMTARGDGAKPIWGTEIGWATGTGQKAVSESQQAAMVAQSISDWSRFSFGGNLFWYNWQDVGPNRSDVFENMGVLRYDGSAKPALGVFRAVLHSPVPYENRGGTPNGPWLVGADARLFSTGGSSVPARGGLALNRPITGSARTPTARGVWMVGGDGGIFTFGDASFFGSTGAIRLNRPIVGMAATPSGRGYWLVASDGGIFSFGDASFFGSTGALKLNRPIVGIARSHTGRGYWMVASDGGMFTFGDASFFGSTGGSALASSIVGVAATSSGRGYWLAEAGGTVHSFGDAGAANRVTGALIVNALTP
ncbi:MAG: polysaccharide biosynthesis protein PslG [Actinomycetota bacterium]|nr:polysaccharide biosynthesis protein PslG [Actinomycetota bacterium]